MTAERADVLNQLDVIMEGIGPTDHVPKILSTEPVFALSPATFTQSTNAGRASLIRKYQPPLTSLRDDERNRCARSSSAYLQKLCRLTPYKKAEFYGFVVSPELSTTNSFEMGPSCFLT